MRCFLFALGAFFLYPPSCAFSLGSHAYYEYLGDKINQRHMANLIFIKGENASGGDLLSVFFPKGTYDPGSMKRLGQAVGGVSEKIDLDRGFECLQLDYELKFDTDFDFVSGGKLPGLAGGRANTGGLIPDGYDGFSTRFLWLKDGGGAVYAYLPSSKEWGSSFGAYKWKYTVGKWHKLSQRIVLNDPKRSDGRIYVYFDGELIFKKEDVLYRKTKDLKIDSFLLSSFFGGNTVDYAASKDSYLFIRRISVGDEACRE